VILNGFSPKVYGSLYAAFPNGDVRGYRGSVNNSLLFVDTVNTTLYQSWLVDSAGRPVQLYSTVEVAANSSFFSSPIFHLPSFCLSFRALTFDWLVI
jgi:hypothetical protein